MKMAFAMDVPPQILNCTNLGINFNQKFRKFNSENCNPGFTTILIIAACAPENSLDQDIIEALTDM